MRALRHPGRRQEISTVARDVTLPTLMGGHPKPLQTTACTQCAWLEDHSKPAQTAPNRACTHGSGTRLVQTPCTLQIALRVALCICVPPSRAPLRGGFEGARAPAMAWPGALARDPVRACVRARQHEWSETEPLDGLRGTHGTVRQRGPGHAWPPARGAPRHAHACRQACKLRAHTRSDVCAWVRPGVGPHATCFMPCTGA